MNKKMWNDLKNVIDEALNNSDNLVYDLGLYYIKDKMKEMEKTTNAEPGDLIKITGNSNSHQFDMGEIVLVTPFYEFEEEDSAYGVEAIQINDPNVFWFIRHEDYKIKKKGV